MLPDLSVATLTQQPVERGRRYTLLADSGVGAPRTGDAALSGAALIGLQAALEHGSLAALQQACAVALPELKGLLRAQLHYHLGSTVAAHAPGDDRGAEPGALDTLPREPTRRGTRHFATSMNPLVTSGLDRHRGVTALSVNVNKVALLRNSRAGNVPSVVRAASIALEAGADGITIHPRPDERHIRAGDVADLADLMKTRPQAEFNIEGNPFHNLMPFDRSRSAAAVHLRARQRRAGNLGPRLAACRPTPTACGR